MYNIGAVSYTHLDVYKRQVLLRTGSYMREVCASSLFRNPVVMGGPGKTVEIAESCFSHRKSEVGRVGLYPQQWVFGGICREDKECFLYAVLDSTAETPFETISGSVELTASCVSSTDVLCVGGKSLTIISNLPTVDSVYSLSLIHI